MSYTKRNEGLASGVDIRESGGALMSSVLRDIVANP